jgi:hypothetical protein
VIQYNGGPERPPLGAGAFTGPIGPQMVTLAFWRIPAFRKSAPLWSLACNHHLETHEDQCIPMTMIRHLAACFTLLLAAVFPLAPVYAVNSCAAVATMHDHESDCGDCIDGERPQCQAYCIALCHSLPASHVREIETRARASADVHPYEMAFLEIPPGGPEPPPPRLTH